MPELPEVETIRRGLARKIIGKRIAELRVRGAKQFRGNRKFLIGGRITAIRRRAKILILALAQRRPASRAKKSREKTYLAIHLKMSGQLIYGSRGVAGKVLKQKGLIIGGHPENAYLERLPNKYTRIIITFAGGAHLYFNDLRRFGWFRVVDENGLKRLTAHLGPDALTITTKQLAQLVASKKGPRLKQLLINQAAIAGLGNIYADESLFCARINPFRLTRTVRPAEVGRLARCIKTVLRLSLRHGGTSAQHYRNVAGKIGTFGKVAKVYGRRGQRCVRCHGPIAKKKLGGRGTHYCPRCQK